MRRTLLMLSACALTLGLTATTASAHEYHRHAALHHAHHGVAFRGGFYYRGPNHHHWSYRVWDSHYCRWHYYDPYYHCFYYWSAANNCYYPTTYCP